jgi:hypothetical protein
MKLGPTGKWPQGKVHPSDEGALVMGVAVDREHGVVVINFGSPVAWFSLPAPGARQLAALLLQNAEKLEAGPLPDVPQ